jgi:hypothetical protein
MTPPANERPNDGRSKAGITKVFCALFFKKALLSSALLTRFLDDARARLT